ncbi:undecaprenyl-diphosphatase [Neolewinella xylanilytica]|uniref:Undecaprenyl-diphosphatase n=1 Tax=Neolewinella xylanilytica TaxID=1514080 RepID=A0A2S6I616_9BACT|nr:phosphatase PAP2 family protein [Neolewinella xylanilytica]PPK86612.1 undecaprenyl-diphosphatase [Neolewinella xylanilytica]
MEATIFEFLNQDLANPFFDAVLPVYRDKLTWIPLYVLIAYLIWNRWGWRKTLYLLLCMAAVIAVADQVAAGIIKPWVGRIRPCAAEDLAGEVRVLVGCGGKLSFPSNHATNHFAVATLLCLTFVRKWYWRCAWLLWALSISLAQVYVGKHYPGDILAGALLGTAIAILGYMVYRRVAAEHAVT